MGVKALKAAVAHDLSEGNKPFAVIATAGTTNTGSIDPLPQIGKLCRRYGLWMHVDGAFGASILLGDWGRKLLAGIELSDSFSIDAHKWLHQTYGCSMVLARPCRSLRLWLTLQVLGQDNMDRMMERGCRLAELAQGELRKDSCWEIVSKASLGIVNFRFLLPGLSPEELDELNQEMAAEITRSGYAQVMTTRLRGKQVIRLCTINPDTSDADILTAIRLLKESRAARQALERLHRKQNPQVSVRQTA